MDLACFIQGSTSNERLAALKRRYTPSLAQALRTIRALYGQVASFP
jgi:hypothetical protein